MIFVNFSYFTTVLIPNSLIISTATFSYSPPIKLSVDTKMWQKTNWLKSQIYLVNWHE